MNLLTNNLFYIRNVAEIKPQTLLSAQMKIHQMTEEKLALVNCEEISLEAIILCMIMA
jgi:hypothetical protein